jgi:hypothetical protein
MQKVFKAGFLVTLLAIFGFGLVMTSTPAHALLSCPSSACGYLGNFTYVTSCIYYNSEGEAERCSVYKNNSTSYRCRTSCVPL